MAAVAHMDRYESYLWHTIAAINAAWCVALCVEPPLGVRPPPPSAGCSSQVAASAESLTAHGRRAQQSTVHLHISDVTPVRHAQGTLSILRAFVACAGAVQTAVLVMFGHYRPLQRRCLGQILGANKTDKIYRNFRSHTIPSIKYIFAFLFRNLPQILTFGTIFEQVNF